MAASLGLFKPGTRFGPCINDCAHRDCAETRRMAETICPECDEPIGYERGFYCEKDDLGNTDLTKMTHSACLERRVQREALER